jgi:hypothetical protein
MTSREETSRLERALRAAGERGFLALAGTALVALGVFVEDRTEVSVTLVVLGVGLMVLSFVWERVEGPVHVGPSGVRAQVTKAVEKGLEKAEVPTTEADNLLKAILAQLDQMAERERKAHRRQELQKIVSDSGNERRFEEAFWENWVRERGQPFDR